MGRFLILTLFVFFVSIQGKAQECRFVPVDGLDLIQSINFNGRTIYTLFSAHLFMESSEIQDLIVKFQDGTKTRKKVLKSLNRMILSNEDVVESEKKDVLEITKLAQSAALDWVGVEHFETGFVETGVMAGYDMVEFKKHIETLAQDFSDYLWSTGETDKNFWNDGKTDQLMYLAFPEIRIAQFKSPQLFSHIDMVYLEDLHYSEKMIAALENQMKDEITNVFMSISEDDMESIELVFEQMNDQEINKIMNPKTFQVSSDLVEKYMRDNNGVKFSHQQRNDILLDFLEKSNLDKYGDIVRDFFTQIINVDLNFIDTIQSFSLERDQFAVQVILETQGNGLILRGSAHEKNIKEMLIKACEKSISDSNKK